MGKRRGLIQKDKLPWWMGWAAGYLAVPLFSIALVYYWRVAFAPLDIPAAGFTAQVALILTVLYLMLFAAWRLAKGKIELQATLCLFSLGLLFCFASAPLQVPDEQNHYLRAYSISQGNFTYDGEREYPEDVALLLESFPGQIHFRVQYQNGELAPKAFAHYLQGLESGKITSPPVNEPVMFSLLPFLPQAAFMALARLFGFKALGLLYAGRIANLVVYSLLAYLTLRNCDKYRGVFIAALLLPLSLFMGASSSYDSLMLALCYLAASYFCKNEIHTPDLVAFSLAIMMAAYIKPHNVILAAILLLIPVQRWKSRWNPRLVFGVLVAVALAFWWGLGWMDINLLKSGYPAELSRGTGGASPGAQLAFVLGNPFRFAAVALLTLQENAGFLFNLGVFGWLDLSIPLVSGLSVLSFSAASALGIQQQDDTKKGGAIALGLAAVGYAGAVLAAMYILETDLMSIRIVGAQPRYFLPAFLLLFMLGSILLGKAVKPRLAGQNTAVRTQQITLWISVGVALVAVLLIFQATFIGQWLPMAEGGWKMVNMFGWQVPA